MEPHTNDKSPTFTKLQQKEMEQFYIEKYVQILDLIQQFPGRSLNSEEGEVMS